MGKDTLSGKKKFNDGINVGYFVPGKEPEGWVLGNLPSKNLKNSQATKKLWKDPTFRNKQMASRSTEQFRNRCSEVSKQLWSDNYDEMCAACMQGSIKRFSRCEEHTKASERMIVRWSQEDYREAQTLAIKEGHKDIYLRHPEYIDSIRKGNLKAWNMYKQDILTKQAKTKSNNDTWIYSQLEESYYLYLLSIYDVNDIKRQYRDSRYPFNCDFYIVSEDKFIEIQGTWCHGGHLFDENNSDDIKQLNDWKEKSKTSSYYKNAIKVWTVTDVHKHKVAMENKLNIEFIY